MAIESFKGGGLLLCPQKMEFVVTPWEFFPPPEELAWQGMDGVKVTPQSFLYAPDSLLLSIGVSCAGGRTVWAGGLDAKGEF